MSAHAGERQVETSVEADDITEAATAALEKITRAYGGDITELRVLTAVARQREVLEPRPLDLVGLRQAAEEIYGVTPQALESRRRHGRLPKPIGTPSTGPVWLRSTLLADKLSREHEAAGPSGKILAFGQSKTIADWARDPRCLVSLETLYKRILSYGWGAERAIITPAREFSDPVRSAKNLKPEQEADR